MFVCGCFPLTVCSWPLPIYASTLLYDIQRLQSVICSEVFERSKCNPLGVRALHTETSSQDQIHNTFPWSTLHLSGVSHQPGHGTQERQRNSGLDLPTSRSFIPMPWHGDSWQIFSGLATNSVPNWESDRDTYRSLQFQIRAVLKSNECLKSDKHKKIRS